MTATAEREAPIAVLGAGSWGTALAIQLARSGRATRLWGRDVAQMRAMSAERRNARYLPGATFPESLTVASELPAALHGSLDVLVSVPSHSFRSVLQEIAPRLDSTTRVAWSPHPQRMAAIP